MLSHLDHLVITTHNPDACIAFYTQVLGMEAVSFGEGRTALKFGRQKINLHEYGKEFEPKAHTPLPGSQDLCFIIDISLAACQARLKQHGIPLLQGPVARTGACGPIESVYIRDPDLNLIELSVSADRPPAAVD